MIDLHCHILPELDDGALDLEDSIAMAGQADADGVAQICATPHIRHDHDVRVDELADRVATLNAELERAGAQARVTVGAELAETAAAAAGDAELAQMTLGGGGRWILLEPAPGPLAQSLAETVRALGQRGYRAVIAHPERHLSADSRERLAELVDDGALIQVTAAFLEQPDTAPAVLDLCRLGLVHVLGSDAHSSRGGRPVALSGAAAALRTVDAVGDQIDWMLHEAPAAIVRGEELEPPFGIEGV